MKKYDLQAIFFDLDDTLFSTSAFAKLARRNALQNMINQGLNYDLDKLYENLLEVIREFTVNYDQHFDKLLLRLPKNTYQNINPSVLTAAAIIGYHDTKFQYLKPYRDAVEFLKQISRMDFIKGIITAGLAVKQSEKLIRLDIYKYFNKEAIFISDQIGISKPNPKLFNFACKKLNLNPSQCIYIGNSIDNDIIPANKAGFFTILIHKGPDTPISPADATINSFTNLKSIISKEFLIK